MTEVTSLEKPIVAPPDNLTVPQFFDLARPSRTEHGIEPPSLVEDETGKAVTLTEIKARAIALSKVLRERWNISSNDVVCISSPNHTDYPVVCWAVHRLGGIIATINHSLTSQEMAHQFALVKPKMIFTHTRCLTTVDQTLRSLNLGRKPALAIIGESPSCSITTVDGLVASGLLSRLPPPDVKLEPGEALRKTAFLCFSSGTTGSPKAVMISHYTVMCSILQVAGGWHANENYALPEEQRLKAGDVISGVLPFFHIYGLMVNLYLMLFVGATVIVTAQFNFEKMLQNIVKYKITHLLIVPPQATLLCKHPATKSYDLSHVRFCMIAAAPVSAELTTQLLAIMPNIQLGQGYGMTETCGAVTMFPTSRKVGTLGSCGQLSPSTSARVIKPDGTLAKQGEPGELWIKGYQNALGYYGDEKATRETFIDGWVRTGDEALFAANGDMFVVDRIKEILKVRGFQVSPAELEGHLLTHPAVSDAAVIGVPDAYSGEVPLAFVVPTAEAARRIKGSAQAAGALEADIKKHVSDAKSRYKWLSKVVFMDVIPKNPSGKILRRELRKEVRGLSAEALKARL